VVIWQITIVLSRNHEVHLCHDHVCSPPRAAVGRSCDCLGNYSESLAVTFSLPFSFPLPFASFQGEEDEEGKEDEEGDEVEVLEVLGVKK
jgi:hypothetical protein